MSTGCAAGPSFDAAASRALLELVERDAASLWWVGGQRPRPLAVDDPAVTESARLLSSLRQDSHRHASWLLDITSDLAIPCVAAVSVDEDGRHVVGNELQQVGVPDGIPLSSPGSVPDLRRRWVNLAMSWCKAVL